MKGKKRCYYCRKTLEPHTADRLWIKGGPMFGASLDCCHACKSKQLKKMGVIEN